MTSLAERELGRARECLAASEVLIGAGLFADAVSRAYYSMFHAATAIVATTGRAARSHDGLRALIGEHFVRTGRLAPELGRALARTAGDRADADYNSAAVISREAAEEDLVAARAFLAAAEALVAGGS